MGGTRTYMSPEQQAALDAVKTDRPVPAAVDRRSDVYSLGLLLYEALGGALFPAGAPAPPLEKHNPQVSRGLSDVVGKCLDADPCERYPSAAALADDLRRHLADRPLRGVPNRSWAERWRKWRRRSPRSLARLVLAAAVLCAAGAWGLGEIGRLGQERTARQDRLRAAESALREGRQQFEDGAYARSLDTLTRGAALAEGLPAGAGLARHLAGARERARRAQAAEDLHALADRLRFLYGPEALPAGDAGPLVARWREVWERRSGLLDRDRARLAPEAERRLQADLLDLGIMWADLRVRLAGPGEVSAARREALQVLDQAETLFGPSVVLYRQRQQAAEALGLTGQAREAGRRAASLSPRSAWEYGALGRSLLRQGKLDESAGSLARALELEPQGFWPNFYEGVCAYRRGRHAEAEAAFRTCIALAPAKAECWYNRGLARAARHDEAGALSDYSRALELDPHLGAAALNRGLVYYARKDHGRALSDLTRALDGVADRAAVHYNLALVHLAQEDRASALRSLEQALQANPGHEQAVRLRAKLTHRP
jgi:tetratricopeptide (TPR) repeat protein